MIGQYSSQIIYEGDSLQYIDNLPDYVFNIIYDNYIYVDSVLLADSIATAFAGNTTSTAYYNKLWELTKSFTIPLFKSASYKFTCLIYTAWVNAGSPVTGVPDDIHNHAVKYELFQNYPNPFNPSTIIKFTIPLQKNPLLGGDFRGGLITLKVYDILGNEIATLVNEEKPAGVYEVEFHSSDLTSGVYFYNLQTGSFTETKKMILIR